MKAFRNEETVQIAYNGAPRGELNCEECWRENHNIPHGERYEMCRSVHAEMNAIISAPRRDMIDAVLYLASDKPNAKPCDICRRLIKNAGIKKVITREDHYDY